MQFGLNNTTNTSLNEVFAKYPQVCKVIIYGSRVKNTYHEGSGIDLCIKGEELDYTILQNISDDIDNLLLPYLVDISIYSSIKNKDLIDHFNQVGETIYRSATRK